MTRREVWIHAAVTVLYAVLAVAWTWPYASVATTALPNGINPTSLPASAGAWALWWVADRVPHAFLGFWDAPIFHPARDAFGYSEPSVPLGLATAPVFWLGGGAGAAYAVVALGSLVLNGLAARWLARVLGAEPIAAFVAGAFLITSSLTWKWLAVMPLVPLFPMLGFVGAAVLASRDPTPWRGAAVGAALSLTWATCLQYGYFVTLCAPALLFLAPVTRRHLTAVAVAVLVFAATMGPLLVPQQLILAEGGMERPVQRAERGGASLDGMWLRAPVPPRLGIPAPIAGLPRPHGGMYPGTLLLGSAAVGLFLRRRDRASLVVASTAAVAVAWSVFPTIELGGIHPFETVRAWVPGLSRIREPRRAAALAMALFPVLGALSWTALPGRAAWAAVGLFALAAANEWPAPMPVQPLPVEDRAWDELVRREVGADEALLVLPFDDGTATPEVDRMIEQTRHGVRMVNGYSSYYPKHYWQIRKGSTAMGERWWQLLVERGVTHVAAPSGLLPPDAPVDRVGTVGDRELYTIRR